MHGQSFKHFGAPLSKLLGGSAPPVKLSNCQISARLRPPVKRLSNYETPSGPYPQTMVYMAVCNARDRALFDDVFKTLETVLTMCGASRVDTLYCTCIRLRHRACSVVTFSPVEAGSNDSK